MVPRAEKLNKKSLEMKKEADIVALPPNLIGWERANQLPSFIIQLFIMSIKRAIKLI